MLEAAGGSAVLIDSRSVAHQVARTDHDIVSYELDVPSIDDADIIDGAIYEILRYVAREGEQ